MKDIEIKLNKIHQNSYFIFTAYKSFKRISEFLRKNFPNSSYVIITDQIVEKLYGEKLFQIIKRSGKKTLLFSVPSGERSKSQKYKTILEEKMLENHIDRHAVIIALGGGVVGDLAGFVAATYMRGISYIQVPTTLLAMVDSSIGGKTAIDTPQGKNMIGAFWHPRAVFVDLKFLESLPQKQFINGLIEAVKMFMTSDRKSFLYVERNIDMLLKKDKRIIKNVILNALKTKARVVERDEREVGERMILNFGHTIGHALENLSKYKILHGYAVALGVIVEARLAVNNGKLREEDFLRIRRLLVNKMGIELKYLRSYKWREILNHSKNDKKTKNGKPHYVILKEIGKVYREKDKFAHPISDMAVRQSLKEITLENNT